MMQGMGAPPVYPALGFDPYTQPPLKPSDAERIANLEARVKQLEEMNAKLWGVLEKAGEAIGMIHSR